jgi:hypothetical protein
MRYHEIKLVKEKTVLCLIVDDQLKIKHKQNDEHCKTISKSIAILRKAKDFVSQSTTHWY